MARSTDDNEVRLSGHLPADPQVRTLPSGDTAWAFRVVVPRPASDRRRVGVDTLECTAYAAGPARNVRTWGQGDVVEVVGALRRRFWRSPTGPRSRYEVEVVRARRVARADS